MKPLCHLLACVFWLLFIVTPLNAQSIDNQTTISWVGFGSVAGSYVTKSGNKSIGLTGDELEIMLWQDRENSGFFDGLQLLQLQLVGTGTDGSGVSHEPKLELLNLQYHLGWNWTLFNFVHLQLFASYGVGQTRFSVALQQDSDFSKNFEEQQAYSDMTTYGTNLILELTNRLWLGYSIVHVQDSQSVDYGYTQRVKRLLRKTDDAFCKIKREWWLIEVEQIHQPFVLSPTVEAGAEQLFKQLTKQLQ